MRMLTGSANINDRCHPDQERGEWRHSSPSTSWHPGITPHTAAYSTTMWVHLEWPHIINCATNTAEGLIVSATTHNPYPWLRNMCSVAVYWEQNILATIASIITKSWVLCHETRWVRTEPVIGIYRGFTRHGELWRKSRYFPGYKMILWCNALCHLSRWPLIPGWRGEGGGRKLDQFKAGVGCLLGRPWQRLESLPQ